MITSFGYKSHKPQKLFSSLDKWDDRAGSFIFANTFHYLQWQDWPTKDSPKADKRPYLVTQQKVWRKSVAEPHGRRSKYVVRPEAVMMAGNHAVHRLAKGMHT